MNTAMAGRWGSALIALAFWAGTSSTAAADSRCPAPASPPEIHVEAQAGEIIINDRRSRSQLRHIRGGGRRARGKEIWVTNGMITTNVGVSLFLSIRSVRQRAASHCVYLAEVKATVGFDTLTIFVAREIPRGSCRYDVVLEHEKAHLAIYREYLDRYAPRIERRLRRAAARLKPGRFADPDVALQDYKRRLSRDIQPLYREMQRGMDAANARLDTPQNYLREQARCGD